MQNTIDQQVIDFTAEYVEMPPAEINNATVYSTIGIPPGKDMVIYMGELEENFGLTYESGDEDGIITVGDADKFIEEKLGAADEEKAQLSRAN